jgi:hypothetical protein
MCAADPREFLNNAAGACRTIDLLPQAGRCCTASKSRLICSGLCSADRRSRRSLNPRPFVILNASDYGPKRAVHLDQFDLISPADSSVPRRRASCVPQSSTR